MVAIPLAASLLAVLVIIMGQRDSIEVSKEIAIKLAAINCEVVQDGEVVVGSDLAVLDVADSLVPNDIALGILRIESNALAGGLRDAHVVLQDGASGNSFLVLSDRSIHVECGPSAVAPSVARTAELIGSTLDGDAHLAAERVAGLGNLLVGDESGLVVLASGVVVVLDQLAVLNQILGQCVVEDLRSFATLDGGDGPPVLRQTGGQADLVGAVQDVDVPAGAGVAFLGGVEVQGGDCLLYTSPSPRDRQKSRMPSSA